jgi:hypothetical protein
MSVVPGRLPLVVADPPRRPPLSTGLSGAELLRWYWLKSELVVLARQLRVSSAGGKAELTTRLVAVLDGRPLPAAARRQRRPGARLTGPLSRDTLIPVGQRSDQVLRAWLVEQIGPGFRFDRPMRTFIADGGRTLGAAVDHWYDTRHRGPQEIEPQFELNRFGRDWRAAHPGSTHTDMLAAWAHHRALPVEERTPDIPAG